MGRKVNLGHLTEEECEQILGVIQKDFDIRQVEKERLESVQGKIQEEDARMQILAKGQDFNESYCLSCFSKFFILFNSKLQCDGCKYYFCKKCIVNDDKLKANVCLACHKYQQFLMQSNSWFYKSVGDKFKRFGSAKVVRSLYKRKADSDAEDDSGYHPSTYLSEPMGKHSRPRLDRVFEMDEMANENDADDSLKMLSQYTQKLEAVKKMMRKNFLQNKGERESEKLLDYEMVTKQQAFNISLLLSSMTNDLTSQLDYSDGDIPDKIMKEAISKAVLEQCISHIYPTTETDHPFNIDPDDLQLHSYIEELSYAIIDMINFELRSSEDKIFEEEEQNVRKELCKLSNRATISQIRGQMSDSELEDLQVTTAESMSESDSKEWQSTRIHSDTASASSSINRTKLDHTTDYDDSEYDVDESSILAFASRKKDLVSMPGFDNNQTSPSFTSSFKQADLDLEVTAARMSSEGDGPWTLVERGPTAMMSKRIPIGPYDNYGEKKTNSNQVESDSKMFLPKRNSIDGPMIGNLDVFELSDLSDASPNTTFDEVHHRMSSTTPTLPQMLPPNDPQLQLPLDPQLQLPLTTKVLELSEDEMNSDEPKFTSVPQDIHITSGCSFKCSSKVQGRKPIDVFWYRDGMQLIQLDDDDRCKMSHQGNTHIIEMFKCMASDAGQYLCIAVSEHGTCKHKFTINITLQEADQTTNDENTEKNSEESKSFDQLEMKTVEELETILPLKVRKESEEARQKIEECTKTTSVEHLNNSRITIVDNNNREDEIITTSMTSLRQKFTYKMPLDTESYQLSQVNSIDRNQIENKSYIGLGLNEHSPDAAWNSLETNRADNMQELHLSYSEFEKLYEAGILKKTRLYGDQFTSDEMKNIKKFLESDKQSKIYTKGANADDDFPVVVDCGLHNINPSQYSRDFDVLKGPRSQSKRSLVSSTSGFICNRRPSSNTKENQNSSRSSFSESEVFESDEPGFDKVINVDLKSTSSFDNFSSSKDLTSQVKKSDLEELTLPSVKELRLKFISPPEPASYDTFRKNRRSVTKADNNEPKFKTLRNIEKPSSIPVSFVPLTPTPINSKSLFVTPLAQNYSMVGKTIQKDETKFEKEVVIRQEVTKRNQTKEQKNDEDDDEPYFYYGYQPNSEENVVVIRPFSERDNWTMSEVQRRESKDDKK